MLHKNAKTSAIAAGTIQTLTGHSMKSTQRGGVNTDRQKTELTLVPILMNLRMVVEHI
jgi:hypothetical protein